MVEYSLLGILVSRAVGQTSPKASVPLVFAITLYFVFFYAITDEFHQSFVPGRSADIHDMMADAVGSAIGAILYLALRKNNTNGLRGS